MAGEKVAADKKGRGRPRKSNAGLREQIPVRVGPELKKALVWAAKKRRRSLTLEIEIRLAASLGEGYQSHVRALAEAISLLAKSMEQKTARPWVDDAFTVQALRAGIDFFLHHFGRQGRAVVPAAVKAIAAKMSAPAMREIYCTSEYFGQSEAGMLIALIENAPPPLLERETKDVRYPDSWWGPYELLRDLGSGWERNQARRAKP
jgi:hypothetical protein